MDVAHGILSETVTAPGADWHRLPVEEVLVRTASQTAGLTSAVAAERLAVNGPNELTEVRRTSAWLLLLRQFGSLIIWILILAGVVSAVMGETVDALAIAAIIVLNAGLGFWQELKAQKSISALKQLTAPRATVQRDGQAALISAAELVVGDVITLAAGDVVAADARLLSASSLTCVESALTGESAAVAKQTGALDQGEVVLGDRTDMVYMGTTVAAGSGQAVVVATAMATEVGRIAGLLASAGPEPKAPLQRRLDAVGRVLLVIALAVVVLLVVLGWLRGIGWFELSMTAISVAVAGIPEGLPAVVTIALSLGVLRMARRQALMRTLSAVETLGMTQVICTDKTGTLTVGEMTVRDLHVAGRNYTVTGEGYGPGGEVRLNDIKVDASQAAPLRELATIQLACNQAKLVQRDGSWTTVGDPTEGALLCAAAKAGGDRVALERSAPVHQTLPFDSDRRRAAVVRRTSNGRLRAYVNGAPEAVLERCTQLYVIEGVRPLNEADRTAIVAVNAVMTGQARRVIGSAYRDLTADSAATLTPDEVEQGLTFVGLSAMQDPPRAEAKAAIERCRAAGIRVVMITGDHPQTALAIARELGIADTSDQVRAGGDLDDQDDAALRTLVSTTAVYARVSAAQKLRIVTALKAGEVIVAMTGDGVNDAPAIKGADIGIAMGRAGTEVTRQAADMVLADDNFATIVAAVEEGRGIFANIRKTLQFLLAGNSGELLLMTVCIASGLPSPLLPIHLLWINLVTDGLPALCLAADPIDAELMRQPPRQPSQGIIDRTFIRGLIITGLLTAGVAFVVYLYVLRTGSVEQARSAAFAVLVFAELLRALGARSETLPIWRISWSTNLALVAVVAAFVLFQFWTQHNSALGAFLSVAPMGVSDGLVLLALGAIPLAVGEGLKWFRSLRAPRAAAVPTAPVPSLAG